MLFDILEVRVVRDYVLYLRFENGLEGEVDIAQIVPFEGVFSKLQDTKFFASVGVDPELGTIVWANGADLSPETLYSLVSKEVA